jgi:predicted double-glycine peptidase
MENFVCELKASNNADVAAAGPELEQQAGFGLCGFRQEAWASSAAGLRSANSAAAGIPELCLPGKDKAAENPDKALLPVEPAIVRLPANQIRVPLTLQSTDYTCGASALQSVLKFYGDDVAEMDLARELKSTPADGTNYKEIARYARAHGYDVNTAVGAGLDDLKRAIDQGKPALVLIQAWAEGPVDYKNDWNDGHYVVATGYDAKNIYFMDPSTLGNYTYIPINEFMDRWHDIDDNRKLNHFFMTVTRPKPAYNPASVPRLSLMDQADSRKSFC